MSDSPEFGAKQVRQHFEPKYIGGEPELHCRQCGAVFSARASREALYSHWKERHDWESIRAKSVPSQDKQPSGLSWQDQSRRDTEKQYLGWGER